MLDKHVPRIIAYLIERDMLFLCRSSFPIQSIHETTILEGAVMEILLV